MNIVYIILSLVILFWVLFKYYKARKNELLALELQSIYDKIEIEFIANENNRMSNDEIKFLKAYKRMAYNPELLDIRCIIIAVKEQRKQYNSERAKFIEDIVNRQSKEFNDLLDKFHRVSFKKVKMSLLNSGFLWICLVVLFRSFFTFDLSFFKRKINLRSAMKVLSPTGIGYVAPQPC